MVILSSFLYTDTAAVILETVPATLGMPIASEQYYPAVRNLCDRNKTLLILDEVQTGLGRTGRLWAFEHFTVMPDMVVLGKGLSGGIYPISGTVLRKPLESVFHPDPHIHVSTFGGSEIGCLVALKVLEISSDPRFLAHVNQVAGHIRRQVEKLMQRHSLLKGLRQLGLFMGLELEDELCGQLLCAAAYQHDLFMVYANNNKAVCQFLPPLIIDERQADWVVDRLDQALAATDKMKSAF
jgi:acetylornithine/succinyldiaminopimelate/putrescine aminotransferase